MGENDSVNIFPLKKKRKKEIKQNNNNFIRPLEKKKILRKLCCISTEAEESIDTKSTKEFPPPTLNSHSKYNFLTKESKELIIIKRNIYSNYTTTSKTKIYIYATPTLTCPLYTTRLWTTMMMTLIFARLSAKVLQWKQDLLCWFMVAMLHQWY